MKVKKILHFIDFGIFPGGVSFSNGFTVDELLKQYKEEWLMAFKSEYEFFKQSNYAYAKVALEKNGQDKLFYFIFAKEQFRFTDYEYCKLAHEALHICQVYLVDILDRNVERETEAYLHTHIMTKCLQILRGK